MNQEKTILLVEDDEDDVLIFNDYWADQGIFHNVTHCTTLSQAIPVVEEKNFDLVFLDLQLPDSRGRETFETMQKRTSSPIIVLTGDLSEELGMDLVREGAQDYLSKSKLTGSLLYHSTYFGIERSKGWTRLQDINKELENFAGKVAHDLRSPIFSAISSLEMAIESLKAQDLEDAEQALGISERSLNRMNRVVESFLNFARTGGDVHKRPWHLNVLLEQALVNLEDQIKTSRATIHRESLPEWQVDGDLFVQVFQNLINNSIKFCTDLPEISITSEVLDGKLLLRFRDNGIGIDSKYHQDMFRINTQFNQEINSSGLGMGLATVQRIISKHGGQIRVESSPGRGSTFHLQIPPG